MDHKQQVIDLTRHFSPESMKSFFRNVIPSFRPASESLDYLLKEDLPFEDAEQLGEIDFSDSSEKLIVAAVKVKDVLTERSSKRKQYDLAKAILKNTDYDAGIFGFYDDHGRFRLSLVFVSYYGTRREFSTYQRFTFFVDPELSNKTFVQQFSKGVFTSFNDLKEVFSLEAVSDAFYREFEPKFYELVQHVEGTDDPQIKTQFALLFVIRTIFIGFVQKRGWLGNNLRFLQDFWEEYQEHGHTDRFYKDWLEPLFFEALSSPPGRKVAYGHSPFSEKTQLILQMAPYLNGELFKKKKVDNEGLWIPDAFIGDFLEFLFQYNFTVEENELYDEELELNPEFLGIIFERLTNMEQGAVYTPRVEVDMMARLALVKWFSQNTGLAQEKLYKLFFLRKNNLSDGFPVLHPEEIRLLVEKLESIKVCDPAAGSGAFLVGMLQVIDEMLNFLYQHPQTPLEIRDRALAAFERKKNIIERSLYGVEAKEQAVWITQLRLWLSLFIDIPEEEKNSFEPLLPSLMFKVRSGDSLVQRIGDRTFPVHGYADLPKGIKDKITKLKKKKRGFFYNRVGNYALIEKEELDLFRAVLDAEIEARRNRLQQLSAPTPKQEALFSIAPQQQELDLEKAVEEQKQQLQAEIANLEEQKRSLKDERPFIWSIEFAEIFFDRGGFDIIIGNPPYVRQEEISDPNGKLSVKAYKEALLEMVRLDFPEYFAKSLREKDKFKKNRKPSGRSDLYTYFYIRSLRLLNEKGVHVFICSNAWLDVGYGAWLQEFFLRKAPLYLVIDNHARRSFTRADINTVITVAGAPLKNKEVPKDHIVRFVAFKKPFDEAINADNFISMESVRKVLKTPDFRVFPITVEELLKEGSEPTSMGPGKYLGDKWGGKYLRAPDIFFTILEKGRGKMVRLGEIAEVRRGFTTGANDFFYLEPLGHGSRPGLVRVRNGAGWEGEIEEEFLKPVIKSPREVKTIVIDPSQLKYRIFMCHKSKEELKGTKALEYIEWGEKQGYQKRPSCRGRRFWYSLSDTNEPTFLHFNYLINDVGRTFVGKVFASDNFHDIPLSEEYAIYLNSIVFYLVQNITGRANFGGGLLKIQTFELARMLVLHRTVFEGNIMKRVRIHSILTEIGIDPTSDVPISEQDPKPLPDRKALDDVVFDTLGLTEEERKEVYRAVAQLVWERISKAKSVRRAQSKRR